VKAPVQSQASPFAARVGKSDSGTALSPISVGPVGPPISQHPVNSHPIPSLTAPRLFPTGHHSVTRSGS